MRVLKRKWLYLANSMDDTCGKLPGRLFHQLEPNR